MDASLDMLSALASRTPQHGLPQPFYTDPAYHALEMELIFGRMWLFVGHTCEIPPTPSSSSATRKGVHAPSTTPAVIAARPSARPPAVTRSALSAPIINGPTALMGG